MNLIKPKGGGGKAFSSGDAIAMKMLKAFFFLLPHPVSSLPRIVHKLGFRLGGVGRGEGWCLSELERIRIAGRTLSKMNLVDWIRFGSEAWMK